MKVQERPRETLDRLPELPHDVVVPDDISGITHPPAVRAVGGGTRWIRWLIALFVLIVVAAVTTVVVTGGEDTQVVEQPQEISTSQFEGPGSRSWGAVPWLPAPQYGSDRHFTVIPQLRPDDVAQVQPSRSMVRYGTDNPVFAKLPDTGEFLGLDQLLAAEFVDAGRFTDIYGIDHDPRFALAPPADTGEYLGLDRLAGALYTTDSMALYGTDNPTFVAGVSGAIMADTGEYLGLDQLGTDEAVDVNADIYGIDDDPMFQAPTE